MSQDLVGEGTYPFGDLGCEEVLWHGPLPAKNLAAAQAFKKFFETEKQSNSSTVQICKILKELGDLDLNGKLRNSGYFFEYLTDSGRISKK